MGLPIDHPNVKGATPLNWTIITHNVEKAHLLLQEGADVNYISIPRDLDGEPLQCYTPLQSLVERSPRPSLYNNEKNVEMAKLLIAYGAETRAKVWCQAERKIISCDLMTDITDRDVVEAIEKSKIIRDVLVAKNLEVNQNQDIRELFYKIIDASIDKVEVTGEQLTSDSLTFVNDITTQYLAVQQSEQIDAQQDSSSSQEQQPSTKESWKEEEGLQLAPLDSLLKGEGAQDDAGYQNAPLDPSSSSELEYAESLSGALNPDQYDSFS